MSDKRQEIEVTNYGKLAIYQRNEITKAEQAGEEMFLGIPDDWYEPIPTYGCENGHISNRYLKSEKKGVVCLVCMKPIFIIPKITEEELKEILK